jgi:hypothetical protein
VADAVLQWGGIRRPGIRQRRGVKGVFTHGAMASAPTSYPNCSRPHVLRSMASLRASFSHVGSWSLVQGSSQKCDHAFSGGGI